MLRLGMLARNAARVGQELAPILPKMILVCRRVDKLDRIGPWISLLQKSNLSNLSESLYYLYYT